MPTTMIGVALLLLAIACSVGASVSELTKADLRRAAQIKPRREYLGGSSQHMGEVLNGHLRKFANTVACADTTLVELSGIQRALFGLRHDGLDAVYRRTGDRRALSLALDAPNSEALAARLDEEDALLAQRSEFTSIIRDSRCRLVVMWFVHHLSDAARTAALRLPDFRLPLLPAGNVSMLGFSHHGTGEQEKEQVEAVIRLYESASLCLPCHADGSESPSPSPARVVPCTDGVTCEPGYLCCCNGINVGYCVPQGSNTSLCAGSTMCSDNNGCCSKQGPPFRRWPDSVDYIVYGGMSGCCSPSNNYTQVRKVSRRWTHRQQLDVNYWVDCSTSMKPSFVTECEGNGFGSDDETCMLDQCKSGDKPEYAQFATCNLLYNGSDIWEFWPSLRRCTKLIGGAGMPTPWGLTDSFAVGTGTIYHGVETMNDVPNVAQNRTCHKWCNPDSALPPDATGGAQCYWMFDDGAPCKNHHPYGVDFYGSSTNGDWEVVEDDGPIIAELPDYCPAQDTPALLGPVFPSPQLVCTKWWFDEVASAAAIYA